MNIFTQPAHGQKYSDLIPTHTARIQCDHCGGHHTGESKYSLESAYNQAQTIVTYCLEHHKRRKQAMADSVINQGLTRGWAAGR